MSGYEVTLDSTMLGWLMSALLLVSNCVFAWRGRKPPAVYLGSGAGAANTVSSIAGSTVLPPTRKRPELRYVLANVLLGLGVFCLLDGVVLGHLIALDVLQMSNGYPLFALGLGAVSVGFAALARYATSPK